MKFDPQVKEDYDILTALRGPDDETDNASTIKDYTTAVLRHFAGMNDNHSRAIVFSADEARESWLDTPVEYRNGARLWWSDYHNRHFIRHMKHAFTAMGDRTLAARQYWEWFLARMDEAPEALTIVVPL